MALSKRVRSNQVLTFEWRKPLMNNTLTMWCFLIKAPYLGKLVMYNAKNVGLSHFSSDESKGLQIVAEIYCSVI